MEKCLICERERGIIQPLGGWIYRDKFWSAGIIEGFEVPGWLILQARRHFEGFGKMNVDEAKSFGIVAAKLSNAIQSVCNAEKVYLVSFGENYPHFHALLATRGANIDPNLRGLGLLANHSSLIDKEEAKRIAQQIQSKL